MCLHICVRTPCKGCVRRKYCHRPHLSSPQKAVWMQLPTHLLHSNKPTFACRISSFNQYIELDLFCDFVDVICFHLNNSPLLGRTWSERITTKFWHYEGICQWVNFGPIFILFEATNKNTGMAIKHQRLAAMHLVPNPFDPWTSDPWLPVPLDKWSP